MHDVDADELSSPDEPPGGVTLAPAIVDAIVSAEAPCDQCRHRAKCASERLACSRFVAFLGGAAKPAWVRAPAAPTTFLYALAFDEPRPPGRPLKRLTAAA